MNNNMAAEGGGIYNVNGKLTVTSTTFSDNSAWYGGGIFDNVTTTAAGAAETNLVSDTISGNRAWNYGAGRGGGIDSANDNVGIKMVGDNVYGNVSDSAGAPISGVRWTVRARTT